jgi:hypothetical protein
VSSPVALLSRKKMNPLSRNCSKLRRFIAEHFGVASSTVPAAFLVIAGLAVSVILSNSACRSPKVIGPTPQRVRPTPIPTDIPIPTAPLTPTLELLPPVTLEEPEDSARLSCESDVELRWSSSYALETEDYYRLKIEGQNSSLIHLVEDHFTLPPLSPGKYNWSVAIVRSTAQNDYELVSEESEWYNFEIAPPGPVVRGISPMSTIRGTSVAVVVSGENFTHSLALTIGVPLQAAFSNPSTITATIPITLEVGEYPVIVKDSTGQGDSYVSFTVSEPPTPVSTARPRHAPPMLTGVDIFGSDVTFHWSWTGELADSDYFALRVGIGIPGESKTWTKETQASWRFTGQGEYVWEVAICRGDPAAVDCSGDKQLVVSERGTFWFAPPPEPKPTPKPP